MTKNVYFSVPADFDETTVKRYGERKFLKYPIREVYGASRNSIFGSGRPYLSLPAISETNLKQYVLYARDNSIEFNYTLNSSCLSNRELTKTGQKKLLDYVSDLYDQGIRKMTIALPVVISLVNKYFPDIEVYLSVMFGLDSLAKVKWVTQNFSLRGLYVHESLYRNLKLLREICNYCNNRAIEVGILVNDLCNPSCPYRLYHHSFSSHSTFENESAFPWYTVQCNLRRLNDPRFLLSGAWIRPDDLEIYVDIGVSKFKISGREKLGRNPNFLRMVESYNNGKYNGDLMELFTSYVNNIHCQLFKLENGSLLDAYMKKVLKGELSCSECNNCGYCRTICETMIRDSKSMLKYMEEFNEKMESYISPVSLREHIYS